LTGQSAELAEFTGLLDLAQHMLEQIALGGRPVNFMKSTAKRWA
jgi:hypothetical protein